MTCSRSFYSTPLAVLLITVFASYLYGAVIYRTIVVSGVFRDPGHTAVDVIAIPNTLHCEDLHYHEPSGQIFTACEDDEKTRYSWFPPLANFDDPTVGSRARGSFKVINPKTLESTTLRFENFDGAFVTHGIDVLDDPQSQDGNDVYIFAVNHKVNPEHYVKNNASAPESHSVVEIFHHGIGSNSVRHVRSVWHPLIRTPNDILAVSTSSFFVTNDHQYRKGYMRNVEDTWFGSKWSNTIFVEFAVDGDDTRSAHDDSKGVLASVSLEGFHNNNGLGHGKTSRDILIGSASSGTLHLGAYSVDPAMAVGRISVSQSIQLDSTIDNPSYFADPYANSTFDGSGYVLAGLSKAANLLQNIRNPQGQDSVYVWMVKPLNQGSTNAAGEDSSKWRKRLLFEDDGSRIRTASSAVLVPIDGFTDSGQRRAQLFVSGFLSKSVVTCAVDL
ncbi:hypothetical protein L249_1108 [Ophiocordyceps polyrhachis-furcata BCC 54312]|uniref:Serum paraoxonase/arylesterase family protein n=1 Tax=Ophiocordyceps polyrhachis-furcata BCC 54312 TaxID=1330021 RepID=A0A367LD44_9HYPO|nr:hypothetical protein L249_1108 [Ophiocordyceps polyrhachis-furcata BCC 54312]